MRTKLVAGNWKMNLTAAEGAALVETFIKEVDSMWDVDVAVCPPFLSIPRVREAVKNSTVKLGAQDCFWSESGAFTGQVSPAQLAEFCCDYCIVGHSETRGRFGKLDTPESTLSYFGETEETVNLKIKALLFHAISPILCVGETALERAAGQTEAVIEHQLCSALKGVDPAELWGLVVAYEPVWAIGTGETCEASEADRVCSVIRGLLSRAADEETADNARVLYGGSVKAENAKDLFSQPNIDGGLVGGASLDAVGFARICRAAAAEI